MAYSTIINRPCKCGCGLPKSFNCGGYRFDHMQKELAEKKGTKKQEQIKKQNIRKSIAVKLRSDNRKKDEVTGETFKEAWFKARRREMTGICECGCGNRSSMDDDANFRSSICHILPQKNFPSVQFHPLNFIEMAFWGGCHTNFDGRGSDLWPKLKCWNKIVERFQILYPLTNPEDHQFIPQILLDTL
jgi:hypothetical protein